MSDLYFQQKYLKYKKKYLELSQIAGDHQNCKDSNYDCPKNKKSFFSLNTGLHKWVEFKSSSGDSYDICDKCKCKRNAGIIK